MSSPAALTASLPPRASGEDLTVTLRVTNASNSALEVVNPDMGRPSPQMNWPFSIETYRASLLMSFGFLAVAVADESGAEIAQQPLETWATPVMRAPASLAPGESVEVPIPLARFFPLAPGARYRVTAEYGDRAVLRVRTEGTVETIAGGA